MTTSTQADLALTGLLEDPGANLDAPAAGCPVCGCQPSGRHRTLARPHGELLVTWPTADYQRPGVKVSEMARAVGLGVRRLHAVSKRDLGQIPFQLLTGIRLYRADQMLNGDLAAPQTVADFARAAGFTRARRFTTACRHRYGAAPVIAVPAAEDRGPQQRQERASTARP